MGALSKVASSPAEPKGPGGGTAAVAERGTATRQAPDAWPRASATGATVRSTSRSPPAWWMSWKGRASVYSPVNEARASASNSETSWEGIINVNGLPTISPAG